MQLWLAPHCSFAFGGQPPLSWPRPPRDRLSAMADMDEIKRQADLERQLRRKREREAAQEANPFEDLMSAGTTRQHHANPSRI